MFTLKKNLSLKKKLWT